MGHDLRYAAFNHLTSIVNSKPVFSIQKCNKRFNINAVSLSANLTARCCERQIKRVKICLQKLKISLTSGLKNTRTSNC